MEWEERNGIGGWIVTLRAPRAGGLWSGLLLLLQARGASISGLLVDARRLRSCSKVPWGGHLPRVRVERTRVLKG